MRAEGDLHQVTLTLSRGEVVRLSAVLVESTLALSRAEFYIRTGCSAPNIQAIVRQLELVAEGTSQGFEIPMLECLESEENPRRPR